MALTRGTSPRGGIGDVDAFATALDAAAAIGDDYTGRLAQLAESLRQHATPSDPFGSTGRYAQLAQPLALRAVRATVHDTLGRLQTRTPPRVVVPILTEQLTVSDGLLGEVPWDRRIDAPRGCIIGFPRRLALRFGALPLLASTVAKVGGELLDIAADLVDGSRETAGRELGVRVTDEDEAAVRTAAIERAHMILSDLVGTAIMGPAFMFALARFATGHIGGGGGSTPAARRPPLRERLGRCLALAGQVGMDPGFVSIYVDVADQTLSQEVAEFVVGLVATPYGSSDEAQLPAVCDSLRAGEIVDVAPVIALNALWSAVAKRSGYLNELALVDSIVARCPPP